MEEDNTHQIQVSHLLCDNHNIAKLLCCKEKCLNCALVCRHETCNCLPNQHSECEFVYAQTIINKVTNKKRTLTKELQSGFKAVEKVYDQAIQSLSKDKENLIILKENYGLNDDQIKFMNAIVQNNRTDLVGSLVYKVKNGLFNIEADEVITFNENEVLKFWKSQSIKFQQIRKVLNEFYYSKKFHLELDFSTQASKNFKFDQQNKTVEKINGLFGNHCLVGLRPLPRQVNTNFELTILKTQNRQLMIGIVTENGKIIQTDAQKSKESILYAANSGQLSNEGITKKMGAKINEGEKVRVQVNRLLMRISWYSNNNLLGSASLTDNFVNQNIYPIIQMRSLFDTIKIQN